MRSPPDRRRLDQHSSTGDELVVRSPYDGHEIDRVPACGADRGGARRGARGRACTAPEPLPRVAARRDPRPRRAAARRAHRGVRPHHRRGGGQADQDRARRGDSAPCRRSRSRRPRRARSPARWCRWTRPTPARASSRSRCASRSASSARSARSTSRSTSSPTRSRRRSRPGARWCSSPRRRRRCRRSRSAELLLDECGLPAGHLNVVTGSGGSVGNPLVDHPDVAMITFTGSPEVGWGIRGARAAQEGRASSSATTRPVIIEPDGDVATAADEDLGGRVQPRRASRASRPSGSTCTKTIADAFLDELVPRVEALVVGDPLDEATDVSALISDRRARPGRGRGSTRRSPAAPRSRPAATERDGVLAPTVLTDVHTRHEGVHARRCSARSSRCRRYTDVDDALRLANDTPLRAAGGDLHPRPRRSRSAPRASSTSAACSSTRCPRGAPTRCPTAASATAATPAKARTTRCAR